MLSIALCALCAVFSQAVLAAAASDPPPEYPVVIGLHQVIGDDEPIEPDMPVVHEADLQSFLAKLRDNGIRTLTMDQYCEAVRMPDPPRDAVLLTVDDGYETVYTRLWPELRKAGMHMTAFVVTDRVGQANKTNPHQPWLTWEQCRELQASGVVDIEAHGARGHQKIKGKVGSEVRVGPWLTTRLYDPATGKVETQADYERRVRADFVAARDAIAENVGRTPRAYCWPYGVTNEFALQAARDAGFEVTFTLDKANADPGCRRRYHFPEAADKALALLEMHPERAVVTEPLHNWETSAIREAEPRRATVEPRYSSVTPPWRSPAGSVAVAVVVATLAWGVLYWLLFRNESA